MNVDGSLDEDLTVSAKLVSLVAFDDGDSSTQR